MDWSRKLQLSLLFDRSILWSVHTQFSTWVPFPDAGGPRRTAWIPTDSSFDFQNENGNPGIIFLYKRLNTTTLDINKQITLTYVVLLIFSALEL